MLNLKSSRVPIYLDSNAGVPLCRGARDALLSLVNQPQVLAANPSSIHAHGRGAKRVMADAREAIAASLGSKIDAEQFAFTSSGSEANQWVVRSIFEPRLARGEHLHWITTPVEHDSNRQMKVELEKRGVTVSEIPLDSTGAPQVEQLMNLITPQTALVSALWVNNETGVITDVVAINNKLKKFNKDNAKNGLLGSSIPLHIDGAQAWGKLPMDLTTLGAQFVTFSGHKIGGLAGTGLVWVGPGQRLAPLIFGKQEKGRRGGTENLYGIVALGGAAAQLDLSGWVEPMRQQRDRLEATILKRISGAQINGGQANRVCNTTNLSFEGVEGDGLVMALDLAGYSVSSGSACSSGVLEPSHVLMAMGRNRLQAMAALRVSFSQNLPWEILEGFVEALEQAVQRLRRAAST